LYGGVTLELIPSVPQAADPPRPRQDDDGEGDAQATSHERAAITECSVHSRPSPWSRSPWSRSVARQDVKQVSNQDLQLHDRVQGQPLTSYVKRKLTITAAARSSPTTCRHPPG
jgi:hypothetical protein